jgi:hypothetical protein
LKYLVSRHGGAEATVLYTPYRLREWLNGHVEPPYGERTITSLLELVYSVEEAVELLLVVAAF